jgi:tetratricopeptide (TPR) repeat protein
LHQPTWSRIGEIFHAALEVPGEERDAFLARECGDDATLLDEVVAMLGAHAGETRLVVEDRLLAEGDPAERLIGRTIGAYRLVGLLGRGGMGDVYLAERDDDQYERRVAFKLLRPGVGGRAGDQRFRRERQILAQLEHPNIATLLDGGVADDGRPYLVVQYVDGEPITEWCRRRNLSLRRRLELFLTVCDAVQAAHNSLVVHRDLKPANILVTADGQVRLLDFGIAKLLDEVEPGLTMALDLVLTPDHAAPEQVTGRAVTAATDVYGLGVLLYELLTDERPFPVDRSSAAAIERTICQTRPMPPSARAVPDRRALRGELDNIVLTALRKEPERRYQSAHELRDDVANYLAGRPVRAQGDSLGYRLSKAARRHRTALAVAAVVIATIAWSLVSVTAQSRRTAAERDRAVAERDRADALVAVFGDLMAKADPGSDPESAILSRDDFIGMLAVAVDDLGGQPDVQALLLETLAQVYHAHGRQESWLAVQERLAAYCDTHDVEPEAVAKVQHGLAMAIGAVRGADEAVPLLRASVDRQRKLFGPVSRNLSIALQDLAEAVAATSPDEAADLMNQSYAMAQALGAVDSVGVARAYNGLGNLAWRRGDVTAAYAFYSQTRDLLRPMLGDQHPIMLTVDLNVGTAMRHPDQLAEGEALLRRVRRDAIAVFSAEHPTANNTLWSLGQNLLLQRRYDEAVAMFDESAAVFREVAGPESDEVARWTAMGAVALTIAGDHDAALARFDSIAPLPSPFEAAYLGAWHAQALQAAGQRDRAFAAIDQALPAFDDPSAADAGMALLGEVAAAQATLLLAEGRFAEAEAPARRSAALCETRASFAPRVAARSHALLAASLAGAGRAAEARTILDAHLEAARECAYLTPLQRRLLMDAAVAVGR